MKNTPDTWTVFKGRDRDRERVWLSWMQERWDLSVINVFYHSLFEHIYANPAFSKGAADKEYKVTCWAAVLHMKVKHMKFSSTVRYKESSDKLLWDVRENKVKPGTLDCSPIVNTELAKHISSLQFPIPAGFH